MLDDKTLALLGDHEAAKRLTDAGVLVPCPGCGGDNIVDWYRYNEVWYQCDNCGWEGPSVYSGGFADTEQARLAWNTRAPILSAEEMEMLIQRQKLKNTMRVKRPPEGEEDT